MPANIMQNWGQLDPGRDFYQSFMAPLVDAQMMQKQGLENQGNQARLPFITPELQARIAQMQMANQITEKQMPFVTPMAQAGLEQQQIANRTGQLNYEQMPGLYRSQLGLQGAQAGLANANAAQANIMSRFPFLLANNPMSALMMGNNVPGFSMGGQGGGQQQGSQPNQGMQLNGDVTPQMGQTEAAVQFLNQNSGLGMPNLTPIEAYATSQGLNPMLQNQISQTQTNLAQNQKDYNQLRMDANATRQINANINPTLDKIYDNYQKASAVGPLSMFSGIDSYAQTVDAFSNELLPQMGALMNSGHLSDSFLNDIVARSKPGTWMLPETMEQVYSKMKSATARADQLGTFATASHSNGVQSPNDILAAWTQFQADYPLTGDFEQDYETLSNLPKYMDPVNVQKIISGKWESPKSADKQPKNYTIEEIMAEKQRRAAEKQSQGGQ